MRRSTLSWLSARSCADSHESVLLLMAVGEELRRHDCHLAEYDDVTVRKVIEVIRVLSKTEVQIIFKDGNEMNVEVEK